MRSLELRRHAPRDPDADRLSSDGQILAERVGREHLTGPYQAVFTSPARRAAETAAWFLRGLAHPVPSVHGVSENLAPPSDERWAAAIEAAGSTRIDLLEAHDPDLIREEASRFAEGVRQLLADLPEGGRGLAVGHTPMIETAVYGLTGAVIGPLRECEGALLVDEEGGVRLERELRLT